MKREKLVVAHCAVERLMRQMGWRANHSMRTDFVLGVLAQALRDRQADSYDNALAETINGLYKAEVIHRRSAWKNIGSVELAPVEWVAWFNHHKLMEPLGYIPPADAEMNHCQQLGQQAEQTCT